MNAVSGSIATIESMSFGLGVNLGGPAALRDFEI